jgi:hypothetical protein
MKKFLLALFCLISLSLGAQTYHVQELLEGDTTGYTIEKDSVDFNPNDLLKTTVILCPDSLSIVDHENWIKKTTGNCETLKPLEYDPKEGLFNGTVKWQGNLIFITLWQEEKKWKISFIEYPM